MTKPPPTYREGSEARENFEKVMRALFEIPRIAPKKKQAKKPATLKKKPKSDKG